jgi:hypothetical protein
VFTITGIRVQHPGISVQDARNRCSASAGIGVQLQSESMFSMGRRAQGRRVVAFKMVRGTGDISFWSDPHYFTLWDGTPQAFSRMD